MNGCTASMWKNEKFLAVRQVRAWWPSRVSCWLSICPFTCLGVGWEPGPPPAVWAIVAYLNPLFELNPQTPKCCHMDLWSAHLALTRLHRHCHHPSLLQQHPELRVGVLSFLSVVLVLWLAAFCPVLVKKRAAFQFSFLSKYAVRVALLFSPLAPSLAASTTLLLEW